jgi:hypothetical protein
MHRGGLMSKVFGSSGKRSNPAGVVSILAGTAGALGSAVLWIYRVHPESTLLGSYSTDLASGGTLSHQLVILSAVLGVMAILGSIAASTGGSGGGYFVGLVLGLVALSYPVLTWLNIVSSPLRHTILNR